MKSLEKYAVLISFALDKVEGASRHALMASFIWTEKRAKRSAVNSRPKSKIA